jgi:hypothetical protein
MWWRVIFIGVVCVLLTLVVTIIAIDIRQQYPGFFTAAIVLDFGIVLGGVKTILETTKTAEELVKLGFDVQKLQLEIRKMQRAEERDGARVVIPTDEQVEQYGWIHYKKAALPPSRPSRALIVTMGVIIAIVAIALPRFVHKYEYSYKAAPFSKSTVAAEFTCGQGHLVVYRGSEIALFDAGENFPATHVVVRLRAGSLIFPLTRGPGSLNEKAPIYVANTNGAVRFLLDDGQIGIESDDGSLQLGCSPTKEERAQPKP